MEARQELNAHRSKEKDYENAGIKMHNCFFGHYKIISITIKKVLLSHVTGK